MEYREKCISFFAILLAYILHPITIFILKDPIIASMMFNSGPTKQTPLAIFSTDTVFVQIPTAFMKTNRNVLGT